VTFFGALNIIEQVLLDGLSSTDILKSMMKEVLELPISDKIKVDIVNIIGECDWRISEGTDESIAMKWLIANIVKLGG
jgi:replication factor C small subunit